MEIVGHRGCADQYPENTVRAVTSAARHLDAVEVDVRRCGSGELVVFHDETVDGLTAASGAVADLPWSDLRDLEVRDSGETIPRLPAVLDAVPDDVAVQVELKERGLAADVREIVAGRDRDVRLSSFLPAALEEIQALGWEVPTGYLFGEAPRENLRTALDLGCDAVHPHYDLCMGTSVVEDAHAEGLRVVAWKAAETAAEVDALRVAGVDGVTADRWDIAGDHSGRSASTGS